MKKFVSYIRVSTQKQGVSGLGMEAQQVAVQSLVANLRGVIVAEFQEVESGRKGAADRPTLLEALKRCKKERATLVIGKLDRLARDVRFFLEVLDDSGVDIRFADLPEVSPSTDEGRMLLINMANFAEFEGRRIGTRTRAALAAARANGVKLGTTGPANLRPNIAARQAEADAFAEKLRGILGDLQKRGMSQRAQVAELNALGIKTSKGKEWSLVQLQRVRARLEAPAA
jgi:DNA invertase Pin-like site-specific DNA recombinase